MKPPAISELRRLRSVRPSLSYILERAEEYLRSGEIDKAIEAFQALQVEYPGTWFDRIAAERLETLQQMAKEP